jgi:mono/diheme cytochrome c family protein
MTIRHQRVLTLVAAAVVTISTSGCQQLQAVFGTRPSEQMPAYKPVDVQFAKQNWKAEQRAWFYHAPQGTMLMPYKWFVALEQPKLKPFGTVPKFADSDYLARFGFLPDAASPENPDGLPVGFARDTITDVNTGQRVEVVGLSCAACHTGQVEYKGKGVRIDGGSGTVDLASFQTELGYAVGFTDKIPFRFERFARAVLGDHASDEDRNKLLRDFEAFLNAGLAEKAAADERGLYKAVGGFGRTDALARIGNFVFGTELDPANLRPGNAPANFPPLWYTSWFGWVQYNASIQQPMVRNIGEALGVRARVNLTDPAKLYQSTVNVKGQWQTEDMLAGKTAFNGLKSPEWPEEVLGPIDRAKAQKGGELYQQLCQHCHLPPVGSAELQDPKYWEAGTQGRRFVKLNVIPLEEIGTDPREATDWANRTAVTGVLGKGTVSAAEGLRLVTGKIREINYAAMGLTPDQQEEWSGYRADGVVAPLAYRARPLGGLWATPPFLHNGSVPNLYEMLVPAEQREKVFYTGSREFDPTRVGYRTERFDGAFEFRTDQPGDPHPGNSNAGHEFRNTPGKGRIGRELSDEERWAIIEYLKTL